MRLASRLLLGLLALLIAASVHYTLPSREVVRILDAYERRVDLGINRLFWSRASPGMAGGPNRDVRFIDTVRPNGRVLVFRNEDTGWSWPPYFKVNSSNLGAEAKELVSTRDNPTWVVITYYGWRSELLSIFPNAVRIREVDSPDIRLFPWLNLVILAGLAVLGLSLWRLGQIVVRRRIRPVLLMAGKKKSRIRGWLGRN